MPLDPALTGVAGSLPLPNTAPTPKNGETVKAEDVQNAVQSLLNQDATLEAAIDSEAIERVQDGYLLNETTGVVSEPGSGGTLGANEAIVQTLRAPHGATITGIQVYIDRSNTGTFPGTAKVRLSIRKTNITTGIDSTFGGPTEDPETNITAYQAHHGFGITGLSEVVNKETTVYNARISGESGANATSVVVYGCKLLYTTANTPDKAGN